MPAPRRLTESGEPQDDRKRVHSDDSVEIALMRRDISYIKEAQDSIRSDLQNALHDFRSSLVTKESHSASLQQRDDAIQALLVRLQNQEKANDSRDEKITFYVRAFVVSLFTTALGMAAAIYQAHLGSK